MTETERQVIEKYLPDRYDIGDDCTAEFALMLVEKDKRIKELEETVDRLAGYCAEFRRAYMNPD